MPSTNFAFSNWSGGLTGSATPGVVIMASAKNVTANFTLQPKLIASITKQTGGAKARSWQIQLANSGIAPATGAQISSLSLSQTAGAACNPSPKTLTLLPVTVGTGSIAVGASASTVVSLDVGGCDNKAAFTVTIGFQSAGGYNGSTVLTNIPR